MSSRIRHADAERPITARDVDSRAAVDDISSQETTCRHVASQRVETPLNERKRWEGWLVMWVP
jgi:hypothetical protein